jgi:hypothetical protein
VQPSQLADGFHPRTQVEVVSIAEKNLNPEFLENILRHAFNCRYRADGHEYRGFDFAMRREQPAGASSACAGIDMKLYGHCLEIVATAPDPVSAQRAANPAVRLAPDRLPRLAYQRLLAV